MSNHFESVLKDQGIPTEQASGEVTSAERVFDAMFRANYAHVLRYASRRSPTRAAAEDIAAETFVVAWRRLDAVPADVLPWLLEIARRLILNEQRSVRRRARLVARLVADPVDPAQTPPGASRECQEVLDALGRLSERDQEVLRLAAWEGLTPGRAATVLGCSRGALAVRLYRARRRLLEQMSVAPAPSSSTNFERAEDREREEMS